MDTYERITKIWHIYTMKKDTAIQKNEILPYATTWKDLEGIMLSEISRETQILHGFTYMWNLKKQNKQTKIDSQKQRPKGWLLEGRQ